MKDTKNKKKNQHKNATCQMQSLEMNLALVPLVLFMRFMASCDSFLRNYNMIVLFVMLTFIVDVWCGVKGR
jgi:ABC-type xylose transport system permease subunit